MSKLNTKTITALVIGLVIGGGLALFAQHIFVKSDVQKAKDAITAKYLWSNPGGCNETNPISHNDQIKMFKKYLKVNSLVNRAVIRACSADSLLAKKPDGKWVQTAVNMNLDTRVNPVWQKACLIQDITIADTVVRPENSGIDTDNLKECQTLARVYDLQIDSDGANSFKLVPL
jgi:predicted HNH restriction endonuclease